MMRKPTDSRRVREPLKRHQAARLPRVTSSTCARVGGHPQRPTPIALYRLLPVAAAQRDMNAPATRYSQSMDWFAIIRDLGWACAITLLIAIAGNYVAALL
jgi:hypothetical protein